jgi:hypothetical protein
MVNNTLEKNKIRAYMKEHGVSYSTARRRVLEGLADAPSPKNRVRKNLTSIVLVADRSGSMSSIAGATEDALKEFVNGQKVLPGDFTIDTVFFDDRYEERANFVDPKVTELNLSIHPRGMTALYDAIGKKINSFTEKLQGMPKSQRPNQVLFVIATDGMENASSEFDQPTIANLIKKQQELEEWKFTFIGANQDAVLTAKGLNIDADSAITFNASDVGAASVIRSLGNYASSVRLGAAASYSDEDRSEALRNK